MTLGTVASTFAAERQDPQGWRSLFNGKDLSGWSVKSGHATYKAEDGTIVGTTAKGSPNTFLTSKEQFADFELEFEVRVDDALNSGVQIRSLLRNAEGGKYGGRLYGPQVEIAAGGAGGSVSGYIYGEATGRGWLTPDEDRVPHQHFKNGQWNHYRVVAQGPRIRTWINGHPIADLTDEAIYKTHPKGHIGLQVHGIGDRAGPFQVAWRNIRIKPRSPSTR